MKLAPPNLPASQVSDPWRADLTRVLTQVLRDMVNQLNSVSAGQLASVTNAHHAAPTGGTYAKGDFVRNSAPVAGGAFGWVCVQSGTPGIWKPILIGA